MILMLLYIGVCYYLCGSSAYYAYQMHAEGLPMLAVDIMIATSIVMFAYGSTFLLMIWDDLVYKICPPKQSTNLTNRRSFGPGPTLF